MHRLFLSGLFVLLIIGSTAHAAAPRPNVVFIFADDWGWGDLSSHGHPWLKTPHLDRLAREGTDFHQFNVLNPVCSPSRAAAMTGMFPSRFGIHQHFAAPAQNLARNMPDWLDARAPSVARFFQQAGYRTAHFGKWHLTNRNTHGAPAPTAYGFDEFAVFNGSAETASAGLHATPDNAVKFINANKDRPFFLNVWLHESHLPHVPTKASLEKWSHLDEQKRVYAAVITDGDNAVGRVLDALKSAGVEQNTIVIFSSDNGPETTAAKTQQSSRDDDAGVSGYGGYYSVGSSGGLRGEKRSLFEGGVRVPFLVRWPGHTPAGVINNTTVLTAVDLLPSLCASAGVTLPPDYRGDGENLLAAFTGQPVRRTRPIFWEWNGKAADPDWWPRLAVRDGDWKLALTADGKRAELHRLPADRDESTDLAKTHPEIVARLTQLALAWHATLPTAVDPSCMSADGRPAEVFSSYLRPTVMRHFQWMREHGIDGVFVQRFINSLRNATSLRHNNAVLEHCRAGARVHGRAYALMYDLSGLAPGQADLLIADWRTLARTTALTRDPAYLHHRGKPLLALWGCGFLDEDKSRPTLEDWRKILTFLKNDPDAGGLAIMLGVPSFWRTQTRDTLADPALHGILQLADVLSPWSVGRYRTPADVTRHATTVLQPDMVWCRERGIDFLPVAFPGFSWHNLQGGRTVLDEIPRLQGRFFWSQIAAAKLTGADMLYVAMFDEVDEATAIFKCTNQPPVGTGVSFLTNEGLPSDHYLRLTGLAGKVIRGEIPATPAPPER